jgi:hypothetical protein
LLVWRGGFILRGANAPLGGTTPCWGWDKTTG